MYCCVAVRILWLRNVGAHDSHTHDLRRRLSGACLSIHHSTYEIEEVGCISTLLDMGTIITCFSFVISPLGGQPLHNTHGIAEDGFVNDAKNRMPFSHDLRSARIMLVYFVIM